VRLSHAGTLDLRGRPPSGPRANDVIVLELDRCSESFVDRAAQLVDGAVDLKADFRAVDVGESYIQRVHSYAGKRREHGQGLSGIRCLHFPAPLFGSLLPPPVFLVSSVPV
jgi:hypothetical protein